MSRTTNEEIYDRVDKLRQELQRDSEMLQDKIEKTYVRIQYFESKIKPLERFVYGVIGVSLTSLLVAVLAVVVKK